jgi:NADPH-dependent 7-cyano-7-deazaguanine reductase QueF-like protein
MIQNKQFSMKEMNAYPDIYDQLILIRVPRQFNSSRIVFSTNGAGTIGYPHTKE